MRPDIELNLVEKFHAILVSNKIQVWHFVHAQPPERPFVYWLNSEIAGLDPYDPDDHPVIRAGHMFDSLEEMIDAAYSHIDPQKAPLPESVAVSPFLLAR